MEKLTEQEKAQLSDEERIILFHQASIRWARKLIPLRNGYKYFIKNKVWILSLLFVLSIVKSSIWYALFGVNIFAYSSLQDIFISFADYFMSIIIIGILAICFYLFLPQNIDNKRGKIIVIIFSIIFLLVSLWFILSLYRMLFSIWYLILIVLTLLVAADRKITLLNWSLFFLLLLTFQPIAQYFSLTNSKRGRISTQFVEQSAHYDLVNFDYNDTYIDTKTYKYYLIGCNSNYYFIFNRIADETLIILKNECKNIKSHPFGLKFLRFVKKREIPKFD
ncbi:MAG: hypothetical protein LBI45_09175 [Bacteroidales bacterium]|jgi:hypothetical protein|nr:hypothetical protein [Bacteroidales bacterium]